MTVLYAINVLNVRKIYYSKIDLNNSCIELRIEGMIEI